MQTYDFVMLAVLGAATLFGFWKGLAWQIASLASIVASYFLALKFKDQLAPMISKDEPWNKFLAMLLIYAGASLAIWSIYRVVGGAIDRVKLNEFDRQMGALVGFGKGVVLCIAITFFAVTLLGQSQRQQIVDSRSGKYIVQILDKADAVAPKEFHDEIAKLIKTVKEPLVDPNYQSEPSPSKEVINQLWQRYSAQNSGAAAAPSPSPYGATSSPTEWPSTMSAPAPSPLVPATPVSTGGDRR